MPACITTRSAGSRTILENSLCQYDGTIGYPRTAYTCKISDIAIKCHQCSAGENSATACNLGSDCDCRDIAHSRCSYDNSYWRKSTRSSRDSFTPQSEIATTNIATSSATTSWY